LVLLTRYSDDQIKKNEMGWVCNAYGVWRGAYRILVGKTVVKRPLGRLRRRWEDNIKMYPQEVGWKYGLN
jgi:hypothetical protein